MIDILLSSESLSLDRSASFVQDPGAGGHAVFIGTVRNQTSNKEVLHLEFEAYDKMAMLELEKIAESIFEKWPVIKLSIQHRTGKLEIGEPAVIISVSSAHRKAAFEACQYAIDTLKETVPIWKKEVFTDGEVWVAAHP